MQLHKCTLERGLLSLIGPESGAVAGTGELPPPEHANAALRVDGIETLAVRSEEGVDLICEAAPGAQVGVGEGGNSAELVELPFAPA